MLPMASAIRAPCNRRGSFIGTLTRAFFPKRKTIWKPRQARLPAMGSIAAPGFSRLWQTCAALLVAFSCWFLNTLIAGAYVTVFQATGLTVWTLAVAGWCGVFTAHKACEVLFPHYAHSFVFGMFVLISAFNPLLGFVNDGTSFEQIGRLAQMLATLATAYALFLEQDKSFSGSASGIREFPNRV
jgi:hypothetical protein